MQRFLLWIISFTREVSSLPVILPPEMIACLKNNSEVETFLEHFTDEDEELKEKVKPVVYKVGKRKVVHYVVKTFRTNMIKRRSW